MAADELQPAGERGGAGGGLTPTGGTGDHGPPPEAVKLALLALANGQVAQATHVRTHEVRGVRDWGTGVPVSASLLGNLNTLQVLSVAVVRSQQWLPYGVASHRF